MKIQKITFFKTQAEFRKWLEKNHDKKTELFIGYYKKSSGKASITWPESVDEALCFGWIDSIRKGIDKTSYTNRFTPRKTKSNWSAVNLKRIGELSKLGLMQPSGLKVFNERDPKKAELYSYERKMAKLDEAAEKKFQKNKKAWGFFNVQPPYYRKAAVWWVVSAKQEETRQRRLDTLIKDSENGKPIAPLTRYPKIN